MREYQCPICDRKERTRQLLRLHMRSHPRKKTGVMRSAERGGLALRAKRVKVTLAGKKEEK
jgi:hypothetical protein